MEPLWDYDASIDALANPGLARDHFSGAQPCARPALCAEMARLAYCDDRAYVDAALARAGFGAAAWFRREGTDAFLAERDDLAVLAFRGTESPRVKRLFAGMQLPDLSGIGVRDLARILPELAAGATPKLRILLDRAGASARDVLTDLDALPEDWPGGGRVHRGFAAALRRVQDDVGGALGRVSARETVFTGHSLGAALATLAAGLWRPDGVHAFGAPRVGDAAFVASLGTTAVLRYVNCCDLVCRLPPKLYRPAGQLHYIDAAGRADGHAENEDRRLEARIGHLRRYVGQWDKVWFRDLADHAAVNYVRALLRNS